MNQTRSDVEAIISFAADGRMQPLYVRHDGVTVKVLSSYLSHVDQTHLTYECTVNVNDQARNVQLVYHIREHRWFMIY